MSIFKIKRVYEKPEETDGYRVLVDRLWPRGIKKEALPYDLWAKQLAPSPDLRKWFHEDKDTHWNEFAASYRKELSTSAYVKKFLEQVKSRPVITLLYAAKDTQQNHAIILQQHLTQKQQEEE